MQALIDFEGWRRWKKRTNNEIKKQPVAASNLEVEKKKRIEELTKLMNSKKDGILLPGISNLSKRKRNVLLKPSKSDSDTPLLSPLSKTSRSIFSEKNPDTAKVNPPQSP
jgi:osomolarity two-component system response regulator SSK1